MSQKLAMGLGTVMIAGGLLGASLTFTSSDVSIIAQEQGEQAQTPSPEHEQMDAMMDMMMGEGASDQMHEAMPGSEELMEACASGMANMMNGMMNGGMMGGSTDEQAPKLEHEEQ